MRPRMAAREGGRKAAPIARVGVRPPAARWTARRTRPPEAHGEPRTETAVAAGNERDRRRAPAARRRSLPDPDHLAEAPRPGRAPQRQQGAVGREADPRGVSGGRQGPRGRPSPAGPAARGEELAAAIGPRHEDAAARAGGDLRTQPILVRRLGSVKAPRHGPFAGRRPDRGHDERPPVRRVVALEGDGDGAVGTGRERHAAQEARPRRRELTGRGPGSVRAGRVDAKARRVLRRQPRTATSGAPVAWTAAAARAARGRITG